MRRNVIAFLSVVFSACMLAVHLPEAGCRTMDLILDASGSMNGKLASGTPKIEAAWAAVAKVLDGLAPDTVLAFRAYGHQSPREKHDCDDTKLLVPFGSLKDVKARIIEQSKMIRVQGYTPITKVLRIAAGDFPSGTAENVIILVSDGKETCEGDPCAAASALRAAGASLVIHTVGFDVDAAARAQLICIATATGGGYWDAADSGQLAEALGKAARTASRKVTREEGPGYLTVKGADVFGHDVLDAAGNRVGSLGHTQDTLKLPAGVYGVTFGKAVWKSVLVETGKTTVLDPGYLSVRKASLHGHRIMDSESGIEVGSVSSLKSTATLIPGMYDVSFGGIGWPGIKVDSGRTMILKPGFIEVKRASINGHRVRTAAGTEVGSVSATGNRMPLPPGDYTVELGKKKVPFSVSEDQGVVYDASP